MDDQTWISVEGAAVLGERMQGRGWRVMDAEQRAYAMDLARQRAAGFVWLGDLAGFEYAYRTREVPGPDSPIVVVPKIYHRCGWEEDADPYLGNFVQQALDHRRVGCRQDQPNSTDPS